MKIREIKNLIEEMCQLRESKKYLPILEADISGLLFHLIITEDKPALCRVHLNTRIIGARNNNQRFDLVIGEVVERQDGRPAVSPEAIIEIKMFPIEVRKQQHYRHFKQILERDLPKLGSLQTQAAKRVEFIFDEVNYLSGKYKGRIRKDVIVAKRDKVARGVNIVFARKEARKWDVSVK